MSLTRFLSHALVGLVAVALGAGAALYVTRARPAQPAPVPAAAHDHAAMSSSPGLPAPDIDAGEVYIAPGRQQLIGVRTADVRARALRASVRATGSVVFNETRITEIHTRVSGWVERADVDFVGKSVARGAPLFSVYSPDLLAAQREYVLAFRARAELGPTASADARDGADRLVQAARERLRLWDVSDDQVSELDAGGAPRRAVTLSSPFDGIVVERKVVPGQYITPDLVAYRLADARAVWIVAEVFERDLASIAIGDAADVELAAAPSARPLHGRVSFIHPEIDPVTRRARVRIEMTDPDPRLKVDAYAVVTLHGPAAVALTVPREAVIDTGTRRYVILARGDGYFRPREVEVGSPVEDVYPVLRGLAAGDRVVTSAQFLIDSESNLMTAMQSMAGMDMSAMSPGKAGGK